MAGMQQMLLSGSGQYVSFVINSIGDFKTAPTTASGSVTFNSSSLITYTGSTSTGSASWISPGLPQQTYYIRLTVNSGTAPTGSPVGSIIDLNTNRQWVWTSTSGQIKTANCTITIFADAAGTTVLASSTFSVDVEST